MGVPINHLFKWDFPDQKPSIWRYPHDELETPVNHEMFMEYMINNGIFVHQMVNYPLVNVRKATENGHRKS